MAGPQSAAPKPATPSRPRRRFTVEQANKALLLVSRIVSDIVLSHEEVSRLQKQLTDSATAQNHGDLERAIDRLQDYVDELSEVGCELKDFQSGLVDFIGRHRGHDVYLCWRLGEPRVDHWHEMHAGFAGRQPVSTLDERE